MPYELIVRDYKDPRWLNTKIKIINSQKRIKHTNSSTIVNTQIRNKFRN